jgi:hypothetical protein
VFKLLRDWLALQRVKCLLRRYDRKERDALVEMGCERSHPRN